MMGVGIFLSGSGTNMEALVRNWREGRLPSADVRFVLSDRADAAGLEKAARLGVPTLTVEKRAGERRADHESRILDAIAPHDTRLLVLAGFMRVLSSHFLSRYPGRIINIHPSLLPSFPGLDAQRQAFDHGVKVTGCTVHFVDRSLDDGPIIFQTPVERYDDDSAEDLRLRILAEEHRLLSAAVATVTAERYTVNHRYVGVEKAHEN
jgi:phosphoribosylglycinamide formyltransferase-1